MPQSTATLVARNTNTMPIYMSPSHAETVFRQFLSPDPAVLAEVSTEDQPAPGIDAYHPLWLGDQGVEELDWGITLRDGVAIINVDSPLVSHGFRYWYGWLSGYDTINAAIQTALADPRVNGIFLRMDSPGGVVHDGINVVTETIRNAEKPIWVYAEMACSAAYWIAAQCPWIIAPSSAMVGSIGACIVHTETSGMLNDYGITVTGISWGRRKLDGASFTKLSDEALEHLQSFVDDAGERFLEAVVTGRPSLTTDDVLDMEARWYPAQHSDPNMSGLDLGLVDEIMSEQEAFEALVAMTETAPATGVSESA